MVKIESKSLKDKLRKATLTTLLMGVVYSVGSLSYLTLDKKAESLRAQYNHTEDQKIEMRWKINSFLAYKNFIREYLLTIPHNRDSSFYNDLADLSKKIEERFGRVILDTVQLHYRQTDLRKRIEECESKSKYSWLAFFMD